MPSFRFFIAVALLPLTLLAAVPVFTPAPPPPRASPSP